MSITTSSAGTSRPNSRIKRTDTYVGFRNTSGVVRNTASPLLRTLSSSFHCNGPHKAKKHQMEIKHGIQPAYTLRMEGHINTVFYYPKKETCTIIHSKGIQRYAKHTLNEISELNPAMSNMDLFLHVPELGVHVGVAKYRLMLLNRSFEVLHEVECPERISAAIFNPWSSEIVTAGVGNIKTWVFRKGAKVIGHSVTYTHGFEPDEKISLLYLESVPGNSQRLFAAMKCSLKIFRLVNGKLLEHMKNIHANPISAIMYFRPLQLLLTASKDGSIKVWDSSRDLCTTFVGHQGPVTGLLPYPHGPMAVSSSLDSTLRVWDLSTYDQVQKIDHTLPAQGLFCEPGSYNLLSYSSRQVKIWNIQQIYTPHSYVGAPSLHLHATSHPLVPMRVLASCADSAVRMVSPVSGDVLSTALLPLERTIQSISYFSLQERLYVLDDGGFISLFDTRENPAALRSRWTSPQPLGHYTCLALYEQAMDEEEINEMLGGDRWLGVTVEARKLSRHLQAERDPVEVEREGWSLLLAGTAEGYVVTLGALTGEVVFSVQAHESEVVAITCNPKRNHVVSHGTDQIVHVWQMYPNVQDQLSLLLTFPLASQPSIILSTRDRLCVACNNIEQNSYTIDLFNITDQEIFSSQAETSHTDMIISVDACHKLKLFASCSLDCTVRIWSEDNLLIRVLLLDNPPDALAFCSQQADLLIAVHSHLCTIANFTYFTESLHKQLMSVQFPEVVMECSQPWSVDLSSLPPQDQARLDLVDNTSISEEAYYGHMSREEMAALELAERKKSQALSELKERETEIRAISDGSLVSKKSHILLGAKEKEKMWKHFLHILRPVEQRLRIILPPEDTFDPDTYGRDIQEIRKDPPFTRGPCYNFFPPLATFDPPYPVAPDGLLPNSILMNKLRKSDADKALALGWKPPTISDRQRRLMEDMVEEEEAEEEEVEQESDIMARLQAALAAGASQTPPLSPTPPPSPPPPEPPTRVIAPRKPIEKLVAPKPTPRLAVPRTHTPTPPSPKSPTPPPTPPPPPTPLPDYIAQCVGKAWFDKHFPDISTATFPKPWSVTRFVTLLLKLLPQRTTDASDKSEIFKALLSLVQNYRPSNHDEIHTSVLALLQGPPSITTQLPQERDVVHNALNLLFFLDKLDLQFAALLMFHYLSGQRDLQNKIMDFFNSQGLNDPLGYFKAALVSMATAHKEEDLGASDSLKKCREWMESWTQDYHVANYSKKLPSIKPAKKSLKTPASSHTLQHKVSFTKQPPHPPALPVYKPIDVINYFVTIAHKNEMDRLRAVTPPLSAPPPEAEEELKRNAIISLPKINKHGLLTRLGDTHCSCCHPERETSLMLLHHLPRDYNRPDPSNPARLWRQFTHNLALSLPLQNINPFLTPEEREEEEELASLGNRRSLLGMVKYFVHEKSYVRTVQ